MFEGLKFHNEGVYFKMNGEDFGEGIQVVMD